MTLSVHRFLRGRVFHSVRVSSRDSERYRSSTSRMRLTNAGLSVDIMDISKSRLKERMSMLEEPMTAVWSSTESVWRGARTAPEEVDANAGLEQGSVVGALGVVDHELVALCADEELYGDAALRGGGDRVEQ